MFDIQRFADDEAVEVEVETTEESAPEEEQPPIPEELEGLPEDIAREAMAEAAKMSEESEAVQEEPSTDERFKSGYVPLNEYNERVNEINQLKAQIDEIKRGRQVQAPQPTPQRPQAMPQSQIMLTPENLKIINTAIDNEAMQLTGMSAEDVASLQYADEGDERAARWNIAREMAKSNVLANIRRAQEADLKQKQQFLENHAAAVRSYNEFYTNESKEADFEQTKNYAVNDYFETLPPAAQQIIAASYARIEKQVASPAEIMLIQNYFAQAKAAYRQESAEKSKTNPLSKIQQANKLPKADQISGTTASGGAPSIADLEKMLNTKDFDSIPQKYQNMLLGM